MFRVGMHLASHSSHTRKWVNAGLKTHGRVTYIQTVWPAHEKLGGACSVGDTFTIDAPPATSVAPLLSTTTPTQMVATVASTFAPDNNCYAAIGARKSQSPNTSENYPGDYCGGWPKFCSGSTPLYDGGRPRNLGEASAASCNAVTCTRSWSGLTNSFTEEYYCGTWVPGTEKYSSATISITGEGYDWKNPPRASVCGANLSVSFDYEGFDIWGTLESNALSFMNEIYAGICSVVTIEGATQPTDQRKVVPGSPDQVIPLYPNNAKTFGALGLEDTGSSPYPQFDFPSLSGKYTLTFLAYNQFISYPWALNPTSLGCTNQMAGLPDGGATITYDSANDTWLHFGDALPGVDTTATLELVPGIHYKFETDSTVPQHKGLTLVDAAGNEPWWVDTNGAHSGTNVLEFVVPLKGVATTGYALRRTDASFSMPVTINFDLFEGYKIYTRHINADNGESFTITPEEWD
jgi:hypothetical protein